MLNTVSSRVSKFSQFALRGSSGLTDNAFQSAQWLELLLLLVLARSSKPDQELNFSLVGDEVRLFASSSIEKWLNHLTRESLHWEIATDLLRRHPENIQRLAWISLALNQVECTLRSKNTRILHFCILPTQLHRVNDSSPIGRLGCLTSYKCSHLPRDSQNWLSTCRVCVICSQQCSILGQL